MGIMHGEHMITYAKVQVIFTSGTSLTRRKPLSKALSRPTCVPPKRLTDAFVFM